MTNNRILVQTDQKQILDFFKHRLKNEVFNIEELPVSDGETVLHKLNTSNYELGKNYLAALSLISKCRYVVFDVGGGPNGLVYSEREHIIHVN